MIDNLIRNIHDKTKNDYSIDFLSYAPISSKTYKVISKDNQKFIVKKVKDKVKNKYQFLKNEGIDNIIYPIFNNNNQFLTRLSNNIYCDDCYYVSPFYEDNNVLNEKKAKDLLNELKILHSKTSFYRKLSVIKSRNKINEIISYLEYKFNLIEAYIREIEAQKFDEFSIPILKNYHYILKAKNILIEKNKKIINAIKEEKSVIYCFIHNNPKIDHLIINNGNKYLISIDNGVLGIPSLDIAKYYIENEEIYFDIGKSIEEYFENYDDDFYYDYFIFLVILFYIYGIIINKKDYITTQSFIYNTNSLKKFYKTFKLQ